MKAVWFGIRLKVLKICLKIFGEPPFFRVIILYAFTSNSGDTPKELHIFCESPVFRN